MIPLLHFNPRFPWGKRRMTCTIRPIPWQFQSTLPVGEATIVETSYPKLFIISIHASRGGSDPFHWYNRMVSNTFQSTLPVGEATFRILPAVFPFSISIHASRGGSDLKDDFKGKAEQISIHASRGGSDARMRERHEVFVQFQSTLPVGEATRTIRHSIWHKKISIHASRGGSDQIRRWARRKRR